MKKSLSWQIAIALWPPAELSFVRRALAILAAPVSAPFPKVEAMPYKRKGIDERDVQKDLLALAQAVYDSEKERRKTVEDKAQSFLFLLTAATSIVVSVPVILSEKIRPSTSIAIVITGLFILVLLFFLTASYYAVRVRRAGAIYLPSADHFKIVLEGTTERYVPLAHATHLVELAGKNQPILIQKTNDLSVCEALALRGFVLLGMLGLLLIICRFSF